MKRVLLTGGAGAIGVHVIAHFMHNTDWEIVIVDSFREDHKGYFDRLTEVTSDHPDWKSRLNVIAHDLCAPLTKREVDKIGHVDYIINLASRSDVQNSIDDPKPFIRNNTELMLNVLEYAQIVKPEVFIQFSTDEVYGPASKNSQGHKEWEPIIPSNPYSASKACQEAMAIAWWRCYNIPLIITNTMNNFGEMQAPSKFPAMIQTLLSEDKEIPVHAARDGEVGTRYYIHSRNTADALLFILKNIKPKIHEPGALDKPVRLNIVGDKRVSNIDLVNTIAKLMNKEPKIKMVYFHDDNPGHDLHYGLDGELLSAYGWKSPKSFEDSMNETIKWQTEHKEWM